MIYQNTKWWRKDQQQKYYVNAYSEKVTKVKELFKLGKEELREMIKRSSYDI